MWAGLRQTLGNTIGAAPTCRCVGGLQPQNLRRIGGLPGATFGVGRLVSRRSGAILGLISVFVSWDQLRRVLCHQGESTRAATRAPPRGLSPANATDEDVSGPIPGATFDQRLRATVDENVDTPFIDDVPAYQM